MMDLKGIACRGILKDLTDLQHHIDVTPYAEQNIYQAGVHDPVYAGKNHIAHIKKHHPHVIKECAAREANVRQAGQAACEVCGRRRRARCNKAACVRLHSKELTRCTLVSISSRSCAPTRILAIFSGSASRSSPMGTPRLSLIDFGIKKRNQKRPAGRVEQDSGAVSRGITGRVLQYPKNKTLCGLEE